MSIKKVDDHTLIEAYKSTGNIWKTGELLGLCGQTVWERLKRLGIPRSSVRHWTEEELKGLKTLYGVPKTAPIKLEAFAQSISRHKTTVCQKAGQLGLTSYRRGRTEAQRRATGRRMKLWLQTHQHPRGAWKGGKQIRFCPSCGRFFEVSLMAKVKAKFCSWKCRWLRPQPQGKQGYAKSGKRADLNGQYFRSRWEANYARYLNFLIRTGQGILKWEYEPDTFEFKRIKRGTRFYTPDFKVFLAGGTFEYHEVKGWEHPAGQTAIKRFRKYYPQFNLVIIDHDWFSQAKRQGLDALIEGWE